jgi:hypothetical protein
VLVICPALWETKLRQPRYLEDSYVLSHESFFLMVSIVAETQVSGAQQFRFHLQEASIDEVHRAIREGQIGCGSLVQLYLNRAKAYNGVRNTKSIYKCIIYMYCIT